MMMGKVLLAEFEMTAAKLDSTRESLQNDPDGTYALGKLQCSRISALPSTTAVAFVLLGTVLS